MPEVNACWCGATARESFSSHYDLCGGCGTLVSSHPIDVEDYTSAGGENVFYGPHYWEEYVPDVLALPGLAERARSDLGERAIYYLERILRHVAPDSTVLELGCAPGSLAYLMDRAGFTVTGIEMGDQIVDFVRRQFGLDVRPGPLEQALVRGDFDAVVMIDVLEHLPRPVVTLEACRNRLQDGGALLIQTPRYRGEGSDWPMLLPAEHLFLYTERSVGELLETAGFHVIEVTDSLFPYDMWIVASLNPDLQRRVDPFDGIAPIGRTAIELFDRARTATDQRDRIAEECVTKDDTIAELAEQVDELRADQRAKEQLISEADEELHALRSDQAEKESLLADLSREIDSLRADQKEKEALIVELTREIDGVRADQKDKEALIAELTRELDGVRADQRDKESLIRRMSDELTAVRADQNEKAQLIVRMSRELEEVRAPGHRGVTP
jgi:SAM-dependent methyltransferase